MKTSRNATNPLLLAISTIAGYSLLGNFVDFSPTVMIAYVGILFYAFCIANRLFLPMFIVPFSIIFSIYLMPFMERTVDGQYYESLLYQDTKYIFDFIIESFGIDYNSREAFLLFLSPLVSETHGYDDLQYLALNSLMLLLTSIFFLRYIRIMCSSLDFPEATPIVANVAIAGLALSPTMTFVLPELMKDIPCLLLTLGAATMFLEKRFIAFAGFLVVGSVIRSYAPLITALYVLVARPHDKNDYPIALVILFVCAYFMNFNPSALVNGLIAIPYIFISPSPFKGINWEWPISIATSEGIILSSALIISLYTIASPDERKRGADRLAIGLFLYAVLLVAVGYKVRTELEGGSYGIGTSGDNFFRKKLPAIPLLYMLIGYGIARFRVEIRKLQHRNS